MLFCHYGINIYVCIILEPSCESVLRTELQVASTTKL